MTRDIGGIPDGEASGNARGTATLTPINADYRRFSGRL